MEEKVMDEKVMGEKVIEEKGPQLKADVPMPRYLSIDVPQKKRLLANISIPLFANYELCS